MARTAQPATAQDLLARAMRACRGAFLGVGVVSALINVLYLTGSFFMLEVYDRVLPSQSIPTLVGLAILVGVLYGFQGLFDFLRGRILVRIGSTLDERLTGQTFDALLRLPLIVGPKAEAMQPVRHLDQIRSFMSGMGPAAFFDLPWMPFYLFICFLFHPLIGWTAAVGALMLVVIAVLTETLAKGPSKESQGFGAERQILLDSSRRNAEVLNTMGLAPRVQALWQARNSAYMLKNQRVADVVGGLGSLSKVLRMVIQSAVLGVGAYLVIMQEATAGLIIAGSILSARALAPVELAVGNWKGFLAARQAWGKLKETFALLRTDKDALDLPRPTQKMAVEMLSAGPPGGKKLIVNDVSFSLSAGEGLGIIGPSASGKSSLARALVGVWRPFRGKVRLDGAALEQWPAEALGAHIGYLPQNVELLSGTIGENIARFDPEPDSSAVIAAAMAAGVHEMILRLPEGYGTHIGEDGSALSAGQRQRVALARALYKDPFLVVLDEPNSNLDADGDAALTQAISSVRKRGGIVVVVAHRPSALVAVDTVLMMSEGRQQAFGPRDEILKKVTRLAPLKVVSEGQGG